MAKDPRQIAEQVTQAAGEGRPPIASWNPDLSGDIDIRICRDGSWLYQGEPLQREAIVRLFASILRREGDGHYYLVTPVEKWRIQVEDTPLLVHGLEATGEGRDQVLMVTTNTGDTVAIGQQHPLEVGSYNDSGEPRPIVKLDHGLTARLVTAAYYELVNYLVESPKGPADLLGVWSGGEFHEVGRGA